MNNHFKHLGLIIILFCSCIGYTNAQKSKEILKNYKKGGDTYMFTVPGFVAKIAVNNTDTEKDVKKAVNKVAKVRVFISDNIGENEYKNIIADLNKSFKKNKFEPLVQVKSDGDIVTIHFLPGTKKTKGEFVVLAKSEHDFVAVILEGKFTKQDVRQLAKNIDVGTIKNLKKGA